MVSRRHLIRGAAVTAAAGTVAATLSAASCAAPRSAGPGAAPPPDPEWDPQSWASVKAQFPLDPAMAQFAAFVFASHPAPVRQRIEFFARELDKDPTGTLRNEGQYENAVRLDAGGYLGGSVDNIAFTDSTTAGLGLLYSGLKLSAGDEILTTEHDFYATHESLRLLAARTGVTVRKARLYADPAKATESEITAAFTAALTPQVKVVALTWVHSGTGVCLPVRALADLAHQRSGALVCLDAVHGFGSRPEKPADLGVDFFASGGHKWLFGPRGTGVLWGSPAGWGRYTPVVPSFERAAIGSWITGQSLPVSVGQLATPGGYHTFEARWSLGAAFEFHRKIGVDRVAARTRELATTLKDGLAGIKGVRLVTPRAPELSAGLVCFEVEGTGAQDAIDRLRSAKVIGSVTPYRDEYIRLGPSLATDEADIDRALAAVRAL